MHNSFNFNTIYFSRLLTLHFWRKQIISFPVAFTQIFTLKETCKQRSRCSVSVGLAYLYFYCNGNNTVCLQERARAAALGYPDPTNPTFEATTEMYHRTLTECLRRIKDLKDRKEDARKIAIMVASHNENTVRFAIEK